MKYDPITNGTLTSLPGSLQNPAILETMAVEGILHDVQMPNGDELTPTIGSREERKHDHTMLQILIVDDYESGRHVLRLRLEMLGYHCHEAKNGAEALKAIQSEHYDLIITDHNMPVMTGLELLQCLAARPEAQRPPVIFVSGHLSDDLRDAALREGASAILAKPYKDEELMREITCIFKPVLNQSNASMK